MKQKDVEALDGEINSADYQGPDRREGETDTAATVTSVRLRFDVDGSAVWEAATDAPQRRADDDTVRLVTALNDESDDVVDDVELDDTVGHRTLMAFEDQKD